MSAPTKDRDYYRSLPLAALRELTPTTELEHALLARLDEEIDLEAENEDQRAQIEGLESEVSALREQIEKLQNKEQDA